MANTESKKGKKPDQEIDLDSVLSELGGVGKVAISRVEPDWCKGLVRSIQIGSSEPVNVDWIASNCGGAKLHVRVYGPDGKGTIAFRTVEICAPPRNGFGIELVRGPDGEPVPVNQLQEARRRYNITHGIPVEGEQLGASPQHQQQPQAPGFDMTQMFQAMMTAQSQQNQTMVTMMANRITGLERLLAQQINNPAQVGAAPQADPVDPMAQLTNTVKTIEQLEKIKGAMGVQPAEPASDASIYTDLIKGFMEMELEKRRAHVAQIQAAQQNPQLPGSVPQDPRMVQQIQQNLQQPTPGPAGPPGVHPAQTAPQAEGILDQAAIQQAMAQIENLPRDQRLKLASAVLGEPIDDGEDWPDDVPDDPLEAENQEQAGQAAANELDLAYSDETGDGIGSDEPPCSEPSTLDVPPRPNSES